MESNIKGLVAAGHEMASELKAECGAVDMRSVAKLISDLATQLEVQLVRANALAAENAALKHAMAVTLEHVSVTDAGQAGVAAMIINDALYHSETPVTDALLAEVRAQAFNDLCSVFVKDATVAGLDDGDIVTVKEATDALLHCAEQLRKGGNQ
ncbi:hypothetical protein HmCmsJML299_01898 [Escherichia coli]|uniref:hypothetical protein n=1 Tax=Escherichia coli TaxID=562 RepID=UPI0010CBF213|nr:hypothetical protein [Escherichia coli]MPU26173.1 hypothetical protein [Escherichia coli]GCN15581.1 hypothetical protein ExPECSC035_02386 [Escherichia coli]GCU04042.1 hypothetical protein HmCms181_00834 [Escherichia coli]GCV90158.1 hypothetical protein HmCmsJML059_01277 [Escherichia coli]GCX28007.1 hypothetical protein HmCmsJML111_00898 [Escherichia coli]